MTSFVLWKQCFGCFLFRCCLPHYLALMTKILRFCSLIGSVVLRAWLEIIKLLFRSFFLKAWAQFYSRLFSFWAYHTWPSSLSVSDDSRTHRCPTGKLARIFSGFKISSNHLDERCHCFLTSNFIPFFIARPSGHFSPASAFLALLFSKNLVVWGDL